MAPRRRQVSRKKKKEKEVRIPVMLEERVFGGPGSAFVVELLRGILLNPDPVDAERRLERLLCIMPEDVEKRARDAMEAAKRKLLEDQEFLRFVQRVEDARRRFLVSGRTARRVVTERLAEARVTAAVGAIRDELRRYIFVMEREERPLREKEETPARGGE